MLHRSILRPLLFRLPPETAHEVAMNLYGGALRIAPLHRFVAERHRSSDFDSLERFGLRFTNPVGLAAGFDKTGADAHALAALGFGFIEVGTATHHAQEGNPRPRLFRLPEDSALVNRLGFNNPGAAAVAANLAARRPDCIVGVNIGKSCVVDLEDAIPDYLASLELIHAHADYIAVNVSSPNTPGLRALQQADHLRELLEALQLRNRELAQKRGTHARPLLVKIAPDLEADEIEAVAAVALETGLSGIIATNTTTARPDDLRTARGYVAQIGAGGLSGRPLRRRSTEVVRALYRHSRGRLPIIGVGGIFDADDAWEKITSGASLVQIWTGFVYEGASVVRRINENLAARIEHEGLRSLDEAIGCRVDEI